MSSPFGRSLPSRPDLAQQKKIAKELLQSFASGDAEARARVRSVLPDKQKITLADAQFVLACEYGFDNWAALKQHIESSDQATSSPEVRIHHAFQRHDAKAVRTLFEKHPALRARINEPLFAFDSPAIVAYANDPAMVDVLLDFGADPNRRSDWWAGGFHALYSATGAAAERLIAAGAIPDACAAAHLDRPDILARMMADDPERVHERGGDGQTPLHFAKSRAVVDLLLGAGADIDARDVDHRATAAHWMLDRKRGAGRFDLARYLVERGASADIFLAAALGLSAKSRAMLQANPRLLDLRIGQGDYGEKPPGSYHIYFWTIGDSLSPLDVAMQFEQQDTVETMLEFASPLQRFHLACRRGDEAGARAVLREHPGIIESMTPADHRAISDAAWNGDARAVALMSELGFDPRTPGHDGGTALHCAAWEGSADTVAILLRRRDAGDLVSIKDARYNGTPLGWCCHGSMFGNTNHDHASVAKLLLEAGARPGPDMSEASPSVEAVIKGWRRKP
ncbi:MAG TPA: ankyrin repeat domain-containing protein [Gemmatimonadaceae bacterium]|nr:ankyrin repeat domain-containing protein [Gemmatimonadaceae bacterium]